MPSTTELLKISTWVRRDIIRMTHGAASGHPGGSPGCADFLTTLYFGIMKPDPENFTLNGMALRRMMNRLRKLWHSWKKL